MRKDYSVKTIVGIAILICATHVGAAGGTPPPIPAKGCDVAQHRYPPGWKCRTNQDCLDSGFPVCDDSRGGVCCTQ